MVASSSSLGGDHQLQGGRGLAVGLGCGSSLMFGGLSEDRKDHEQSQDLGQDDGRTSGQDAGSELVDVCGDA